MNKVSVKPVRGHVLVECHLSEEDRARILERGTFQLLMSWGFAVRLASLILSNALAARDEREVIEKQADAAAKPGGAAG